MSNGVKCGCGPTDGQRNASFCRKKCAVLRLTMSGRPLYGQGRLIVNLMQCLSFMKVCLPMLTDRLRYKPI
ncbi:hypothetical protein IEO21_09838 [Rhodonia placenta]|uniref:Uncharacterized protein n=1 Tax=Rhodonia placenta TaxID=104341 RepID=A0A8H7NTK5_9APHY|nr:hypothetical protein IEO21_09838 [Postia placenta]